MNEEIEKRLESKNIKPTAMRQLVFDVLRKQNSAISLYDLEKQFDKVDRSTLFRTLKTFQKNCIIHSIDDGTGALKYALCEDDCSCNPDDLHIHFLCNQCGHTYCFKDLSLPLPDLPAGFNFESANFVVKGTCSGCS